MSRAGSQALASWLAKSDPGEPEPEPSLFGYSSLAQPLQLQACELAKLKRVKPTSLANFQQPS